MAHTREVRLGLVLYGGVSLAVYENGVAQELYRAMRGDGIYGLIQDLIDSDIVVDIISGTSAGGVNGVMLAYALANGCEFTASADLWREQADIQALLRTAKDPDAASILNSKYYQDRLQECFSTNLKKDNTAPAIEELDLFVTGTDAHGDIYTIYDDQGHPIDVKNHRALFRLSYREGSKDKPRKNDLAAPAADLAKLSRITSCFPVAFEPVEVAKDERNFFRWGRLRNPAVYLDGGILNNKPFTSTIDAIARRTANREVERFLIYVEPDPESFPRTKAEITSPESPSVVQAGASSLLSIPRYQSIASDLDAIEAHNERAQRIVEIFDALPDAPVSKPECLDDAGVMDADIESYDDVTYYAARFIQLRDSAITGILNDSNGRPYILDLDERRSGRILVESFNNWPGPSANTLVDYDVFFRMRRAKYFSRVLMRRVKAGKTVPPATWDLVNHYFKLYEMVEWALVSWLDSWHYPWRKLSAQYPQLDTQTDAERSITLQQISTKVWGDIDQHLKLLLLSDVSLPAKTPDGRSAFYDELAARLKEAPPKQANPPRNLLLAIDDEFKASLKQLGADEVGQLLRNEFCRFLDVDQQIFPIEVGSGFESIDTIRVVRFSPMDAQRGYSKGAVDKKVCGIALGAFGGFFKKSWRASDIMMGRMDAACLLLECLLTKERLSAMGPQAPRTAADIARYFPYAGDSANQLVATINGYLAAPVEASMAAWSSMLDQIVLAYHEQIYAEEWPTVERCAIEQEYAWSRYLQKNKAASRAGAPASFDRSNLLWTWGKNKPDQVLVELAAQAISSGAAPPPFRTGVAAGAGFLDQVPSTVLEELGALATIRVGKSLLASIESDETRSRVRDSSFYKWPFTRIAPVVYRWARIRRTEPDSVIILNTAIPVACVALIACAAFALTQTNFSHLWFWIGGVPLIVLIVWFLFFRK